MKTWVTYIAALLMGFATALLFRDVNGAFGIFQTIFYFLLNLSIALFIPIVLITFSSGVASLRKDSVGSRASLGIIGWSIATSVLLPIVAIAVYELFPTAFPTTSSTGTDSYSIGSLISSKSMEALSSLYPANPFMAIGYVSTFLLPIVIIAWILGVSLKPSSDVIRPAYTVMNSFSEVMYRISRTVTLIGSTFAYFSTIYLFMYLYREKTIFVAPRFLLVSVCGTFFILLIVLPLLYALFTGFRKNPYSIIGNSISSLSIALTTGNIISADLVGETIARHNCGAQKRVVSVSTPIFTIIGRGGTGFITTLTLLMLIQSITGDVVSLYVAFIVAATTMLMTLTSSIFVGYEIVAIAYLVLSTLKINTYGAEMAIISLLPFLGGLGTLLDSAINNLGAIVASFFIGTDIKVPYSETI